MLKKGNVLACLIVFAALALGQAATAEAVPVIVNGNFETFVPSNSTGGGWTSANIDFNGGWRASGGNPNGNFVINQAGELATDPTISQSVSGFTVGQTYTLSGDYASFAPNFGNPALNSFAISVGGTVVATLGRPASGYGSFSVNFVAGAADLLIGFRTEINGDDSSFRIDNIALREAAAAIPEPATLFLLGGGLAGVGLKIKRRNLSN